MFVVLAEVEWIKFTKYFGFLKYWPARGLFYVFVGLITWDQVRPTSISRRDAILLEYVFEPVFKASSHIWRAKKGCLILASNIHYCFK